MNKREIYWMRGIPTSKEDINEYGGIICYHCKNLFEPEDIKKFLDKGNTAICPKCNRDSIIPACNLITGKSWTNKDIEEMRNFWFSSSLKYEKIFKIITIVCIFIIIFLCYLIIKHI